MYRTGAAPGVFATLAGPGGAALFDGLAASLDDLRAESGMDLPLSTTASDPFKGTIGVRRGDGGADGGASDAQARAWLIDATNRMVDLLRPRLAQQNGASPLP